MRVEVALSSSSGDRTGRDVAMGAISVVLMFRTGAVGDDHVVSRSSSTPFCVSDPQTSADERVRLGETLDWTFWSWLYAAEVCFRATGRGCLLVVMNLECRSERMSV